VQTGADSPQRLESMVPIEENQLRVILPADYWPTHLDAEAVRGHDRFIRVSLY